MKIIEPRVEVWLFDPTDIMRRLELAGRTCYKSESKISSASSDTFIQAIVKSGHESILEHCSITVRFIVDRGVTHEIVRHRIAAYSQESTRYCRYGDEITIIRPFFWYVVPNDMSSENLDRTIKLQHWKSSCLKAEEEYLALLRLGATPQEARSVLPNSLKTELVTTYNIREWRHFFRLRCTVKAHPQMQQVAIPLMHHFSGLLPVLFGDIPYNTDFPKEHYAEVKEIKQ